MGIPIGWLLFAIIDGALAYTVVYCLLKAWFKGKNIGRILGIVLGTIIFGIYIAIFVYFYNPRVQISDTIKNGIYAAPIVMSILLFILAYLSMPPKIKEDDSEETDSIDSQESEDEIDNTSAM
ncbi:MAG: hypothetical protein K6G63_07335 [Eubacterium sp.]|nr:hypothetical protein [Eubacterium sp.]